MPNVPSRPHPRPQSQRSAATLALLIALAPLIALTGCASTQPVATPAGTLPPLPERWSTSADGTSTNTARALEAQWWARFDDPLLARLVDEAMQHNATLASAQAALRQARALRDVAAAGLLPAVNGSGSAQRSMAGGHSSGNAFQAGLDASWELDLFGAQRSAVAASQATAQASAASLGDAQVSLAAEVALGYMALRGAQAQWQIATTNLASQRDTAQITLWRQQAGLVTVLEAEQARAAAEQTAASLPALATRAAQARHALAVLTGQAPAALDALLATPGPVPRAASSLLIGIPTDTLRQRADVRAAEFRVQAAAAQVSQARAARLPSFKLGGSLGLAALTPAGLGQRAALLGSLLGSVTGPVFDGGAGAAQVQAQQAALDAAGASYRASVLTALQEVEDALIALAGDQQRLLNLQAAAQAAGNAAQLARQRFASGLVDFQTVLETQRTQLSTQDSVASASVDLGSDQVRLYKALGGGWRPEAETAAAAAPASAPSGTPPNPLLAAGRTPAPRTTP